MQYFLRVYHIFFSIVLAYTLGFLFLHTPAWEFFSYITNLTGILIVGIFLYLGLWGKNKIETSSLRGAVLVYSLVISLAFVLLLENKVPVRFTWVSFVQHRLIPIALIIEWFLNPPTRKLTLKDIFIWLTFPTTYFFFSIIRGYFSGWYPYRFFDPEFVGGYLGVFKYFIGLFVGGLLLSLTTITLGNKFVKKV